jgi:hypothetical protein
MEGVNTFKNLERDSFITDGRIMTVPGLLYFC